mgnify:CR=1 FL=1
MTVNIKDIQNMSEHGKLHQQVLKEIEQIKLLFESKNSQYKVSPVVTIPTESWCHQIKIKSERALQVIDDEKRIEDLKDCAVYCLLAIAKEHIRQEDIGEQ